MTHRNREVIADEYWQAQAADDPARAKALWDELGAVIDAEVDSSARLLGSSDPDGYAARAVRAFGMVNGVPADGRPTWRGCWHHPDGGGHEWWHGVRGAGWIHDGNDDEFPYVVTVHQGPWVMQYVEGDVSLSYHADRLAVA